MEARHFIEREFAAAQRGRALAVVMFGFPDLDRLSAEVGRSAAEDAVVEFGRILQRMTRRMNLSARCGWRVDAFLSVLSDADSAAAHKFVQRVREAAANAATLINASRVGVAVFQPHMRSPEELVSAAEDALAADWNEAAQSKASPRPFRRSLTGGGEVRHHATLL